MSRESDEKETLVEGRMLGPYELLKRVGTGGMGVVFQARDTERNTVVALKTLHKLDPVALLKLKNEFRGVANVTHPNLVTLYELRRAEDVWFFTMEYVEGDSLSALLKRAAGAESRNPPAASLATATFPRADGLTPSPLAAAETVTSVPPLAAGRAPEASPGPLTAAALGGGATNFSGSSTDTLTVDRPGGIAPTAPPEERSLAGHPAGSSRAEAAPGAATPAVTPLLEVAALRRIFGDLALGICALHEAGKLHCDIKPGNVMVATDGRVVLLDFGLITEFTAEPIRDGTGLAGTPAYMAPEQAEGRAATEASDWYALGVMLYEVLCGHRPFSSHRLRDKVQREAPPLPVSAHIPEDLRGLCMALLSREPASRPKGREVVEQLRGSHAEPPPAAQPVQEARALVGRQGHLAALLQAYQETRSGRGVTVHVHGRSGMGKTVLIHRLLADLRREGRALILGGRCYERESVPYKAFDALIDSLTRYLRTLSLRELRELLPANVAELARVFPVLRQLPDVARPAEKPAEAPDQSELRRRAFRALKELLARLARKVPLVLHIDDLQWGDPDSFVLLNELLSPPDAPPLLLLCSFRSEEAETSALLAEHRQMRPLLGDRIDIREVEVGPLSEADAVQLAATLLGDPADPRAAGIARESHGNPFFVEELARYALATTAAGPAPGSTGAVTLEQVILSRVDRLPEPARHLLEVVAVAGRRIAQGLATRAAEVGSNVYALWNVLRISSLVQTRGTRDADPVECYHDRIRESVNASLPPERLKAHHHRLAEIFEASGAAEPEELARHYLSAGMRDKAGTHLTLAADRAAATLAFDYAAELYGLAAGCMPEDPTLKVRRADALVNAGRCAESAPLYLEAAQKAPPEETFHHHRRACEQLLASGHIDEGLALLAPLMNGLKLRYPPTPRAAMMGLVGRSLQLSLRGTRFQERPEAQVPPELLKAADLTWAAAKGLSSTDLMRSGYFSFRSIQLALETGEPRRISRSLAYLGLGMLTRGRPADVARSNRLMEEAQQLAKRLNAPELLAFVLLSLGTGHAMKGELRASLRALDECLQLLEGQCTGVGWETSAARAVCASVLWYLGEFKELAIRSAQWVRYAEEIGDLYGSLWMRLYSAPGLVAADAPEEAEQSLQRSLDLLSRHSKQFTPQHLSGIYLTCEVDLYRGAPERVLQRLDGIWKVAKASFTLSTPPTRIFGHYLRGMSTLALARANPADRKRLLARAEEHSAHLRREDRHYARGPAALVRAGIAHVKGQRDRTLAELDAAIAGYEQGEMSLRAVCARRRKGELLGNDEGRALIQAADAALRAQGIRDVERWMRMYSAPFSPPPGA